MEQLFTFVYSYYYLIAILQGFCLYHAYKKSVTQQWYYLILFLPFIGSLIYLYENFYTRQNIHGISQGVKEIVIKNYKIESLEKNLSFSDTFNNKLHLADAYFAKGRYGEAIELYKSCLTGIYSNNPEVLSKLANSFYLNHEFKNAVSTYNQYKPNKEDMVLFAQSLAEIGMNDKAEEIFIVLNTTFSNFIGRIAYSKFLLANNRNMEAKKILTSILAEYEVMSGYERKIQRAAAKEANQLLKKIN